MEWFEVVMAVIVAFCLGFAISSYASYKSDRFVKWLREN